MSTSSQYYRSTTHYQPFPSSNHDHMYVLAAPWQHDPNHDSYAGPPPAAPYLPYNQAGADSASLHHPAAPTPWNSGYHRQESHEWNHPVTEQNYPPRPTVPYSAAEGGASVPHPNAVVTRLYQHQQALPSSPQDNPFRSTERFNDLRVASESPASAIDPPFSAPGQKPPPSSQYAQTQSQASPLHNSRLQVTTQPSAVWEAHPQYPNHTANPLAGSVVTAGQSSSSATSWPVVEAVGSGESSIAPAAYERLNSSSHNWVLVQAQHGAGVYAPQPAANGHFHTTNAQLADVPRSLAKKKVAKVPSSFVERQEKLKVSKRKGPLQDKLREKTHIMRKNTRICVRCRFYKSGCDEGHPCQKCEKITGNARSFREPCYREHLEDTSLVRRCNGREHQEEAEFLGYDWVINSQLFEMEILWNLPGYGPIRNAQPLRVTFRPYAPRRGSLDMAASLWSNKDGQIKSIEQPAYAIYDTANLVPAFERYFSHQQPAIETWIFARICRDEVASLTYKEVVRMRTVHGSRVLDLAMRIQCLSVVSQGYGSVLSDHIPGIKEYDYRNLGHSDYEAYDRKARDRPLPGAITHQMDVAAVKYLRKLEKAFVKEVAVLIFKPRIKPWYELFLAFYVIFWNLEYIHHGAKDYIKSKNGTLIENQVSNVVTNQIKKWEVAFPVFLYHWRCILRGYSPFRLARDNPDELRDKGHIDPEGYDYVTKIAKLFDRVAPDRFQPPLTGFAATHWTTSSKWIVKLFEEGGA